MCILQDGIFLVLKWSVDFGILVAAEIFDNALKFCQNFSGVPILNVFSLCPTNV